MLSYSEIMPYPYSKIDGAGIEYLRSVTAPGRVTAGADILPEYAHDEMPEYGVFPPDVYVEAENTQEVSAVMGQEAMVRDAILSGAKGFIVKPFKEDGILSAISKLA